MHPILFTIPNFIPLLGGLSVHTYGVLVATGFLLAMWWASYDAKTRGVDPNRIMDLAFYIILSGVLGSRLMYLIVTDPGVFVRAPLDVFKLWQGGVAYYGGVIGALLAVIIYTRKYHLSFWTCADIIMPGLAIGHAVGRLGCLMAGCCHGLPTPDPAVWYAIVFPNDPQSFAPAGVPVYPTQLMEAAGEVCIFLFLVWRRHHQKFTGQIFALYIIVYAIMRGILETFRGDTDRGYILDPWISTSQGIAILMLVGGVLTYGWRRSYVSRS